MLGLQNQGLAITLPFGSVSYKATEQGSAHKRHSLAQEEGRCQLGRFAKPPRAPSLKLRVVVHV